jgi:hypothetical protein
MKVWAVLGVFLGVPTAGLAENAAAPPPQPACGSAEQRQFDFWVGEWSVTQGGKVAGTNRIERILDGCALLESWTGASGFRGNSLNFYDATRRRWHQTWVDTSGLSLAIEGELAQGSMVLAGTRLDPGTQKTLHDRITWTPNPDGTVRQLWETSSDGKAWTTAFDGLYTRVR